MPERQAPVYNSRAVRLVQRILADLRRGRFLPGERLPAERELAPLYGVSRSTIRHTLELLVADQHLVREPRRGVKVPARPAGASADSTQVAWITLSLSEDANEFTRGLHAALDPDFTLATYCAHADIARYGQLVARVAATRPAGMILQGDIASGRDAFHAAPLMAAGIPVVVIGETIPAGLVCDQVRDAPFNGARVIAQYLTRKNYRDLAFITSLDQERRPAVLRDLRNALQPAGIALPEERVFYVETPRGWAQPPDPYSDAQEFMARLLADGFRCATLLVDHDYPAVGVLRALLAAGIRVPEEMQVVSMIRCHVEGATPLRLTTMDDNREASGCIAGNVLRQRLANPAARHGIHYVVAGEMIVGETG
ncbi:MAG: GntR family transcriptional regulator [Lentisphaeria bacterium]